MNRNKNSDPFFARGFGDAAPWLDFVNSELWDGYGNLTEMLDDPTWVKSFLHFRKWRESPGALPQKQFRRLRALLRQLVALAASGKKIRPERLATLNEWLKIPMYARLEENQYGLQLVLRPVQSGWSMVLANIVSSFAESLVRMEQRRMKICQNRDCKWVFIDSTKGNVRRWCSAATCGNRERVRRARAAQKQ
jgi:predicted RNA-binding Zn ribbon-like protein